MLRHRELLSAFVRRELLARLMTTLRGWEEARKLKTAGCGPTERAAVWTEIAKIDDMGGMVRAIEERYPQGEIERSAYAAQQALERGEQVVVGLNKFVREDAGGAGSAAAFQVRPEVESEQRQALAGIRAARDGSEAEAALAGLRETSRSTSNLMPPLLRCVRAQVSVGEICHALRREFGQYRESR